MGTAGWDFSKLRALPLNERLDQSPPTLRSFLLEMISKLDPDHIWIFGSRARGDHRMLSDLDIAVSFSPKNSGAWLDILSRAEDEIKTLLDIQWVRFDEASQDMKQSILDEGITVYEKK